MRRIIVLTALLLAVVALMLWLRPQEGRLHDEIDAESRRALEEVLRREGAE